MKKTATTFLFSILLISCGKESSPEGRLKIKVEEMSQRIDSLKNQNDVILDSLKVISERLNTLKLKQQ